ncbi:MAG TPA: hypothetical protein VG672_07880, partial [Bryobacteraceae bacterium]|nr:hypothetical protein [Bryobacteraceae bacterium]
GLLRALDWKGTDRRELLALREKARADFSEAAYYLRLWPDPHLALARVYVYSLLDAERAMSEFRSAERLGYRLKPREIEQQGDAYRYRAYQKIREGDRNGAAWYAGMARRFYERIPGYGRADLRALEMRRYEAAARKPAQRRSRRWQ